MSMQSDVTCTVVKFCVEKSLSKEEATQLCFNLFGNLEYDMSDEDEVDDATTEIDYYWKYHTKDA